MSSKAYFTIAIVFIVLYVVTSFAVIKGFPEWVHQVCTVVFAVAAFLGYRQRKRERDEG